MPLSFPALLGIFFVSLFFSGCFSMLEAAVISQDKHRLQHLADEGDANAIVMRRLLDQTDRLLSTLLLCNNLANVACAATATAIAARLLPEGETALLAVTFIVTFILLVFSEITPKVIGVRHASAISLALAPALYFLMRVLLPFTAVARFCSNCLLWLARLKQDGGWRTAISVQEIRAAVRAAVRSEEKKREHFHIVEKTLRFDELTLEKIMTPRSAIKGINIQDDEQTICDAVEQSSFNKLLLFDGNLDKPVGIVEVLGAMRDSRGGRLTKERLRQLAAPVHYLPAAAAALPQLENMRRRRLALIADGGGRVIGMVTFANFAAAIIGDDTPLPPPRPDGTLALAGDTTLLQLEQLRPGTAVPEIDAVTLNGMLLEHIGFLPPRGVCVEINDWRFEVLEADANSIRNILLLPPRADDKQAAEK